MKRPEDKLQRSIVDWVRLVCPTHIIFSIPNGGARSMAEGQMLRLTGMLAGIPDLCLIGPGGKAYFIECKSDSGALSARQRAIIDRFIEMSVPYCVARSVEDVRVAMTIYWKIPTREAA